MKKKTKQLIIVALTLAILGGIFLITNLMDTRKAEKEADVKEAEKAALAEKRDDYDYYRFIEIPSDEIVKVEMITPEERAVFEMINGEWDLTYPEYEMIQQSVTTAAMSVAGVGSSTIVEKNVKDWAVYGIDKTSPQTIVTGINGETVTLVLGSKTPTGSGYYVKVEGDNAAYMIYTYSAESLILKIDQMRNRTLPQVNIQALTYIKAEGDRTIELVPFYDFEDFSNQFSTLLMVQPYDQPSAVNSDKLGRYMEAMLASPLEKITFVNEYSSLTDLGLDEKSARTLTLRDQENQTLTILVGNPATEIDYVNPNEDGSRYTSTLGAKAEYYARLKESNEVFTVSGGYVGLVDAKAFPLRDSFVRLVNIDDIDAFAFTYKNETWGGRLEREGEGDDLKETYFLNNLEWDEDTFKDVYQDILYIIYEGEIEGEPFTPEGTPEVTIRYIGTEEHGSSTRADLYPYDDQYYAVSVDGQKSQFLVGRYQIEDIVRNMNKLDL